MGELDGLRQQVVASLGVLLRVIVLTHRRVVVEAAVGAAVAAAGAQYEHCALRPRRRHRRPAARRARRRRLLAPRGHRAAHLAEAKALREQPHVRGARARVGHDAPRREARPRPPRGGEVADAHAAAQERVDRARVRQHRRRRAGHLLEQRARRDEVADRAVAFQQRRVCHDVWREAGGCDRVERAARARHVARHHVRVDDIAMRVERRRNSFGRELRERAQRALQLPPLRRLADLVRELGGAVVGAGPRHRRAPSKRERGEAARRAELDARAAPPADGLQGNDIAAAPMSEATPALYRWQGKKGVVDAELAKSHVWAAEGDEFCVQDSKPHALLVSVEGVPGLKLITPDEARRMGCAPRPAVPSWRRASMAPTGMTPTPTTTPSMTAWTADPPPRRRCRAPRGGRSRSPTRRRRRRRRRRRSARGGGGDAGHRRRPPRQAARASEVLEAERRGERRGDEAAARRHRRRRRRGAALSRRTAKGSSRRSSSRRSHSARRPRRAPPCA